MEQGLKDLQSQVDLQSRVGDTIKGLANKTRPKAPKKVVKKDVKKTVKKEVKKTVKKEVKKKKPTINPTDLLQATI